MNKGLESIFREYYAEKPFIDRFVAEPNGAVDVIIPVVHTNELWEANLISLYREIPIHKLLIGDGGCIDDSIEVVQKFPRVHVLDHHDFESLGYSIRKLIEEVETEWFIYLHSDVYLPSGWFDAMQEHQAEYDWFGCLMQHTIMVEYRNDYGQRPWAGSQMGRKRIFDAGLSRIDDDFVYRQEDFVFADIVKRAGGKEGKITDTFHYHQTMHKPTPWSRKVKSVMIDVDISHDEDVRTWMMQGKGIVKYLQPDSPWVITNVVTSAQRLIELGVLNRKEYERWVKETNPAWLPYLRRGLMKLRLRKQLRALGLYISRWFSR